MTVNNWSEQIGKGAVLLTVNQRLSRHHFDLYQQWQLRCEHGWWETPHILPFRSWMSTLHKQAVVMGLSKVTLVSPLLVQRAWHAIVESDSSVQLLDNRGAARSALQAWDLSCAWHCVNPVDQYLSDDQFAWQRWMLRYRSWLEEQQGIDEALLADELSQVLQAASTKQREQLLPECLILDGFLQLPAQLEKFMDVVKACGVEVKLNVAKPRALVHNVEYADDDAELAGIAAQMRAELDSNPKQSLGLVVPDLQQRRDAVVRAFERIFYPALSPLEIRGRVPVYEISLGESLSDQAIVASALRFLRLLGSSISGSEITAVLLSPYWIGANREIRRREQMDKHLRNKRIRSLDLEQFSTQLYKGSELEPVMKALQKLRKLRAATLSEWADRFSDWLKRLGWPGSALDSEEYQAASAWYECLDDMQLLDDGKALRFEAALAQLTSLATDRVFQLETPATPIQVMGRLESHGLQFDCLWVAGLDADQWPPAGSANAFLSITAQKVCQVPGSSPAGRLALAEKEYRLWASQSPLLVASFARHRDGKELPLAALPPVEAGSQSCALVETRLARLNNEVDIVDPVSILSKSLHVVAIEDYFGPTLVAGTKVGGGARLFENQALCPFRAFALHRLKIRPLEEVGIGLDPRQHGTLLHEALERFWSKVKTHAALLALDEEALDDIVRTVIHESMNKHEVPSALQALELTRLTRLLTDWLVECESVRAPFTVVQLEQKKSIEHGGIVMEVVIDRVDQVDDSLVVIDYKTGVNNKVSTWADNRISNPQLPLYVLTDEQIEAASFAQVATNQSRFIGIASDADTLPNVTGKLRTTAREGAVQEPLENWSQWRAHWQTSLDNIAAELREGIATITPMTAACNYCELKSLCRVSEEALADGNGDPLAVKSDNASDADKVSP